MCKTAWLGNKNHFIRYAVDIIPILNSDIILITRAMAWAMSTAILVTRKINKTYLKWNHSEYKRIPHGPPKDTLKTYPCAYENEWDRFIKKRISCLTSLNIMNRFPSWGLLYLLSTLHINNKYVFGTLIRNVYFGRILYLRLFYWSKHFLYSLNVRFWFVTF